MNKLLIGLISHKPQLDFRVMAAIEQATPGLLAIGWQPALLPLIGNADLAGARNTMFAIAYTNKMDKLLFVDADVSWEPGMLERLVAHDVDLVAGAYPAKQDTVAFPVRTLPGPARFVDPVTDEDAPYGLLEIAGAPTGMMCISHACMDRMVTHYADSWYGDPKVDGGKAWNVFEFAVYDNKRMTEDFNFCRLWREMGGKVWCDPHLVLHHHGEKTYTGRLTDHLISIGRAEANGQKLARPIEA